MSRRIFRLAVLFSLVSVAAAVAVIQIQQSSEECRLAHISTHIFDSHQVVGCRRESCAGAPATRIVQDDDGWVHAGPRTAETPSARTTCGSDHAHGNSWSRLIVVECCGRNCPDAVKSLILWRPRRDLNPCYRRERTTTIRKYNDLQEAGGHLSPC
jgi:hypothetical protein